jgi:hypothetical protein
MTKLQKLRILRYFILLFVIIAPNISLSQAYSIDDELHMKSQRRKVPKPSREEKRMMKIEKKTIKKQKKEKRKNKRLHKRAVKKHNKLINGGGRDLVDGKKTHKRMKRSKREAKRINKGKNPVPWIKRIFR